MNMNVSRDDGHQEVSVALDIGTSKVLAVAGRAGNDGEVEVVGIGHAGSGGLNKGVIVDITATANSIRQAVANMELVSPCGTVRAVHFGLAGMHIQGYHSCGSVMVDTLEVSSEDVEQALGFASSKSADVNHKRTLHIEPQEYMIDSQRGIQEPCGMVGKQLIASAYVIDCNEDIVKNMERCIDKCDLEASGIVANHLATADAVLTQEEKNLGTCLIDIGSGTSDVAVFVGGSVKHVAMIPLAGHEVSSDVSAELRVPRDVADQIKIQHGYIPTEPLSESETIHIEQAGVEKVSCSINKQFLSEVISARYREILTLILQLLQRGDYQEKIAGGIVLTGGATCIKGIKQLAEDVFGKQVRIAIPQKVSGLNSIVAHLAHPAYATGVGILRQAIEADGKDAHIRQTNGLQKLQSWFKRYF